MKESHKQYKWEGQALTLQTTTGIMEQESVRVELLLIELTGERKIGRAEVPLGGFLQKQGIKELVQLDLEPKGKVTFSVTCHGVLDSSSSTLGGGNKHGSRVKYLLKVFDLAGSQMPETEAIGLQ